MNLAILHRSLSKIIDMFYDEIILLNICIFKNTNLAISHRSLVLNIFFHAPMTILA